MGEIPNKEARPEDIPQDVWDSAEIAWKRGSVKPIEQIARVILAERERCAKVARRFVGYADSDAGSAHPRAAKELAESTASWIEQEIMEPTAHG